MSKITLDNWKDFKSSEAHELFSPKQIVMYEHGFTRYTQEVGQVEKITPTGIVYVKEIELKRIGKVHLKPGRDWMDGGYSEYDPKKIISKNEELLRFMPSFESHYENYKFHNPNHPLIWKGKEHSGLWHLRPIELTEEGRLRLHYDPID